MDIDKLDARIILLVSEESGISVVECARRLGVARATVQSRLDRLRKNEVISSMAPRINTEALGYPLRTICSILIKQEIGHRRVAESLRRIPELVSLHTTTGDADMVATLVARSTKDLQRILDLISNIDGIDRVWSRLALETYFEGRTLPLIRLASEN